MAREMKDSGIEWIGKIPKEWEVNRLKNILLERKESNNPVKTKNILSLTNDKGVIPYSEKGNMGNKAKEDLTGYKLAYPNDIVLNSMNIIIGSVGLSKYYGCVSPVYYMLYSNDKNIKYYNYIFQTKVFQNSLKGLGNGILEIRMRIPMEKLNNVILPIPPLEKQEKIVKYLDKKITDIDLIIEKTKATIEDYKKYKQSIITEAVTKGLNPNVEMKDSGIEWIGKIPKHWEVTKVKNIAYKVTDGAHVSPEIENGIYDFVSTVNLKNNCIDFDNCLKTSEKSYAQLVLNNCNPKKNDVLISKDGTVGKTVVIDFDKEFIVASSLVIIRTNTDLMNPYFLNYNLKSKYIQDYLILLMVGAGLKRVSVEKNANLLILMPSLIEQQQIVEYLDKKVSEIDNLIAKKESLISEMEEYKKSLIYECVTGKKEVI